ncbi:MAG: choice-of-anchor L domain-containing protein [Thiolinea sp.]
MNKKTTTLQRAVSAAVFFTSAAICSQANATFLIHDAPTSEQLTTALNGPGLNISNLSITKGEEGQYGLFKDGNISSGNGPVIGVDSGIFMTTGNSGSLLGPNDSGNFSKSWATTYEDADLITLSKRAKYDPAIIEFDIVPAGDRLNFVLTFGSEEYPEYTCSKFNDAFGLFVSGPGLDGVQNAAYIPGTQDSITVNNINNGTPGSEADGTACILDHAQAFSDNGNGTGNVNSQLDGFTKPMTAFMGGLIPNETYRVKLALADAADAKYDSGAFFKWLTSTSSTPSDLSLNASSPEKPVLGETTTITYTVHNHSDIDNGLVQTLISLPDGLTLISDDSNGDFFSETGEWNVGSVPANSSRTLTLTVMVQPSGDYTTSGEIAFAFHEDPDSTPFNRDTQPTEDDTAVLTLNPVDKADDVVRLQLRALLQGAFRPATALMHDKLRTAALIPTAQPYAATPFSYNGAEQITPQQLELSGADAIVDWMLLQIRDQNDSQQILLQQAVLVQRDGDLINAATGETTLELNLQADSYYVSLLHRNHLGVMTENAISLSDTATLVDFTRTETATYGTHSQLKMGDIMVMWGGDANADGLVVGNGPGNDTTTIMGTLLTVPENTTLNANYRLATYDSADLNMDGVVVFAGADNDSNLVLGNILLHPGNETFNANYVIQRTLP